MRPQSVTLTFAIVLLGLLVAVGHLGNTLLDYPSLSVHPDFLTTLKRTLHDGLAFGSHDFINTLQLWEDGEFRPRWLAYFIQAIDQKLRLRLYDWMPVHPTVQPLAWLIQLVVAPYFLYRLVVNLTADRLAGLASVAVFVSANGFLSGFTMALLQGKTLTNAVFILALYLASVCAHALQPGQSLTDAPRAPRYLLLLVLFLGLFLDEQPLVATPIVAAVFWPYIVPPWPWHARLPNIARTAAYLALPTVAFLGFVVLIAPLLTQHFWGYRFDYLGDTLLLKDTDHRAGLETIQRRFPELPSIILENATTLFGMSLAPWHTSPFITSGYGEYPGSQVTNLPKIVTFAAFFGVAALLLWRIGGIYAKHLAGLLLAIVLYITFISIVQIRHIPIATGYYYGSGFAALFALLVGMLVHGAALAVPAARPFAALAVLAIVAVQIANFGPINAGWAYTHNETLTRRTVQALREGLRKRTPLSPPRDLSADELREIWAAWKRNRLDQYLRDHPSSPGAVYAVFEVREINRNCDDNENDNR